MTNYKTSKKILKKIQKADKVVINCHRGPDPDSIGSALAASYVLKKMGKQVQIVCSSAKLDDRLIFLKDYEAIINSFDFQDLETDESVILLALDSASWDMVVDSYDRPENLEIVVIDHHITNTKYGNINLVDKKASSVGETLYKIFQDWRVDIDKDTANALLTAIIGDTGSFKYPNTTSDTLKIAGELSRLGADKNKIIFQLFRRIDAATFNFAGQVLKDLKVDETHNFVWAAVDYETYKGFGKPVGAKDFVVSIFTQSTKDTNFGFFLLEKEKNAYAVSLRARKDGFDVSKIAISLGGGGHAAAAGGGSSLDGVEFDEAVSQVLKLAKNFAKKNKKA